MLRRYYPGTILERAYPTKRTTYARPQKASGHGADTFTYPVAWCQMLPTTRVSSSGTLVSEELPEAVVELTEGTDKRKNRGITQHMHLQRSSYPEVPAALSWAVAHHFHAMSMRTLTVPLLIPGPSMAQ